MRLGGEEDLPTHVYSGGTTTERMVEYIDGPLGETLRPGDIVVADRLSSHRSARVAEALADRDAEIKLLPPYSPDLNPIERLWGKLKDSLRAAKAKTVDRLRVALDEALEAITNCDIAHWFAHSDYCKTTSPKR